MRSNIPEEEKEILRGIIEEKQRELKLLGSLCEYSENIERLTLEKVIEMDGLIRGFNIDNAGDNEDFYKRLQLDSFRGHFLVKYKNTEAWRHMLETMRRKDTFNDRDSIIVFIGNIDQFFKGHTEHMLGLVEAFDRASHRLGDPASINISQVLKSSCMDVKTVLSGRLEYYLDKILKELLPYLFLFR